ncbi:MAG: hypothetical protein BWK79_05575 [Beggiatoa sp. IS2]|nr:MAG: hypothetical protein BWK79_05575 [Beggiatoa sp. IS2]
MSSSLLTLPLHAEDTTKKHAIDRTTDTCMEKDSSTVGMTECLAAAQKQWDTELNRVYNQLMAKLDKTSQAKLKAAQLQWLKYRDAEFAAISAVYASLYKQSGGGTMWGPMSLSTKSNVVKERALALLGLLNSFSENSE